MGQTEAAKAVCNPHLVPIVRQFGVGSARAAEQWQT